MGDGVIKSVKNIYNFIKFVREDDISLYAAQSSFFLMISSIPFVLLCIAVAKMFVSFESYTLIAILEPYIPYNFIGIVEYVINEVYEKSASFPILSVSALTLAWSASKGLSSIAVGICRIYKQKVSGYIKLRLLSICYTFLFVIIFIAVLVFMVFGRIFNIAQKITEGPIATVFVLALFFSGLYYVASKRNVGYPKHIIGSVVASIGWSVFSYIFAIHIEYFVDYSYIYGSLGIMAMFMIWLYICMYIVLIGAKINMFIIKHRT